MQEKNFVLYMLNGERYFSLIIRIIKKWIKLKLYNKIFNSTHHLSHQCKDLLRMHSVWWKVEDLFHARTIFSPTCLNLILQIQALFSQTIYFEEWTSPVSESNAHWGDDNTTSLNWVKHCCNFTVFIALVKEGDMLENRLTLFSSCLGHCA